MKLLKNFEEITSFAIGKSTLGLIQKRLDVHLLDKRSFHLISSWKTNDKLQEIYANDLIFWSNTTLDGKGIVFDEQEVRQFDGFVRHCFSGDAGLVSYQFTKFDTPGESIKFSHGNMYQWSIDDFLTYLLLAQNHCIYVGNERNQLIALNDINGNVVWNKKLPENFSRFLGFSNGTIWLVVKFGQILGVNIHTGEEQVNLLKPAHYPASWDARIGAPTFYLGQYTQLDSQQNKLFGLRDWYYWEIDLANPADSYTLYDLEDHFRSFQMEANANLLPPFDGNRVFFGSIDRKGPTLGIFDRQQRQIVWTSGAAQTDTYLPSVRQMAYVNQRLYALDGSGTLHIFEDD